MQAFRADTILAPAPVRVLRFDRPEKRNALTPAMLDALWHEAKALRSIDASEPAQPRAILLTGTGDVFCAGFDLSLCQHDDAALATLLTGLARCIAALRRQPLPVVLSAHGAAVAGACALLGAADCIVSTRDAKIGYPVVKLGISPAVSAPTLVEQAGTGVARARLLDTQLVSGEQALALALVHEVQADASACEARALALAQQLASKPPHALQATRRWCQRLAALDDAPPAFDAEGALRTPPASERALQASLALVGGAEERAMLPAAWKR
jgi:enoyl-CoA hydratase/carnithine racemase